MRTFQEMQAAIFSISRIECDPNDATVAGIQVGMDLFTIFVLSEETRSYWQWCCLKQLSQHRHLWAFLQYLFKIVVRLFQTLCDVGIFFLVFSSSRYNIF